MRAVHRGPCGSIWKRREQPDLAKAFRTIIDKFLEVCGRTHPDVPLPDLESLLKTPARSLSKALSHIARHSDRPWVIFFDEADCLVGETMVSFLTQLREGYLGRSQDPLPASIVLVGRRQVCDFMLRTEDRHAIVWLGTSSPSISMPKP